MTLVLNEIHMVDGLKKTVLMAAADRRVINVKDGSYVGTHRKVFEIPYLNGAVSFFGLAAFKDHTGTMRALWELLPAFIRKHADVPDLRAFSHALHRYAEAVIPRAAVLAKQPSGFHICGYGRTPPFVPDYWFLTNIRDVNADGSPSEWKSTYKTPGSHFLGQHAKKYGWDGSDPASVASGWWQLYRNGDFAVHALTADLIDGIFKRLRVLPAFKEPRTPSEYKKHIQFKFELVAAIHQKWMRTPTIGRPVDVLVWTCTDGKVTKV